MDFQIVETTNGGDLNKVGNDIGVVLGFENMPYLAMFGGNVEASKPSERLATDVDLSYWGNADIFNEDASIQFNSLTERTLNETPLTSSGRLAIQRAVDTDLEFMRAFSDVTTTVTFPRINTVQIDILVIEPSTQSSQQFQYIWDVTKGGLVSDYDTTGQVQRITKQNAVLQNVLQLRL